MNQSKVKFFFQEELLKWWEKNKRAFPWRSPRSTEYEVLVAEILLQRTKAEQVIPIYETFLMHFPSFISIASAETSEIQSIIHPLGLSKERASRLRKLARIIIEEREGIIPATKIQLINLPGIGSYSASAFLCFAKNIPVPIIDSNVVRVLTRFFGLKISGEIRRKKEFIDFAEKTFDRNHFREYNYAILDFSAKICKPRSPACIECPLILKCRYAIDNKSK